MALVPDMRWTDPNTGAPTNIPFKGAPPQFRDEPDAPAFTAPKGPEEQERLRDTIERERRRVDENYDGVYPDDPSNRDQRLSVRPPEDSPWGMPPTQVIAAAVGIAALLARFGMVIVRPLIIMLRGAGIPIGQRVGWSTIPIVGRQILLSLGIIEGTDLIFDTDGQGDDAGVIPLPFFGGGSKKGQTPPAPEGSDAMTMLVRALYAGGWYAHDVAFFRLTDGRLAVRNNKGVWKIWRPKKPIVIMPTGQSNMRDILRAERVLDRQADKMAKMLRSRGKQVRSKVNPKD